MPRRIQIWLASIVTGSVAAFLAGLGLFWLAANATAQKNSSEFIQSQSQFPSPSPDEWKATQNEVPYARNYARRIKRPFEKFEQTITVYETPMAADRRVGKEIAPGEYLEIFKVGEQTNVVVQVREDRGNYWLLSRQRIIIDNHLNLISQNPEYNEETFKQFQIALQDIIDSTRHFLRTQLRT